MADKIFANGLIFSEPSPKAPAWVKGKIAINVADFIVFLEANQNEKGWVNLDVLKSKTKPGCYAALNTYKKPEGGSEPDESPDKEDPF